MPDEVKWTLVGTAWWYNDNDNVTTLTGNNIYKLYLAKLYRECWVKLLTVSLIIIPNSGLSTYADMVAKTYFQHNQCQKLNSLLKADRENVDLAASEPNGAV